MIFNFPSKRSFFSSLFVLTLGISSFSTPYLSAHDLVVDGSGYALWKGKKYRCATGKNGLVRGTQRVEGSETTPTGTFKLLYVMYRPDRVTLPPMKLHTKPIKPESAWCREKGSKHYNTYIERPTSLANTSLFLPDLDWFDVVGVLDFNTPGGTLGEKPLKEPVLGVGYGIFMHIRKRDYQPSRGCIGLAPQDLMMILEEFDPETDRIVIQPAM